MVVLGLKFFQGPARNAVTAAHGLCVFPSAPGLATLDRDARYRDALLKADVRYVDSGFLALAWFVISGKKLCRVSGLYFLRKFFKDKQIRKKKILWINPTTEAQERNKKFISQSGFPEALSIHTVSPLYPADKPIRDAALLEFIELQKPEIIVINLGGGTQEPLGAYIKERLSYAPTLLCTGGALDFLTGAQAVIPDWADKLVLGWLLRVLSTPRSQAKSMRISPGKRYLGAFRLFKLLVKWRERLPA
jgi:UDP-N-acetyl-D-mannosaminuronic acid transferase (WecB/TagA/CpsF family)